jgi:hypothetical protein
MSSVTKKKKKKTTVTKKKFKCPRGPQLKQEEFRRKEVEGAVYQP